MMITIVIEVKPYKKRDSITPFIEANNVTHNYTSLTSLILK